MKQFAGYCLGGPLNGQQVVKLRARFYVPVMKDAPPITLRPPPFVLPTHVRRGLYEWNENQGTFVFQGYGT